MKIKSILKIRQQHPEFNEKITNLGLISLAILALPLTIYLEIIKHSNIEFHTVFPITNNIVLSIVLLNTLFYKKIPYQIKRTVLVLTLFFLSFKGVYLANIEYLTSTFIVIITYYVLTSTPRTSILIIGMVVMISIIYPILIHYNIISFYYNPLEYHYDTRVIIIRLGNTMLAIGFMTSLIFYVFVNNKKNIEILESNIEEITTLNEKLKQEIKDREEAEHLAVEQANNYLTLFNNSFDGFILASDDHKILEVNQSMLNLSGFDRDDLINKNLLDFIDSDNKEAIEQIKDMAINGQEISNMLINTKTKDGKKLILQIQAVAIKGDNHFNILSIVKDVTKQHLFMEELRKREELYRTLFEQTNESILIMNGTAIVDYNAIAKKLYHIKEPTNSIELPYTNIRKEFEEPNKSIALGEKISLTLAGQPQSFEWKHAFLNSKKPIYTLVNLQELKVLGPKFYMVVEKDITVQKRNQNLILNSIIQTEENERKRISSDLHDGIGPLLTTIKLYTQALSDSKDSEQQSMIRNKLIVLIEDAVNSISEISFNISPHILLNHGVVAAVSSFIEKFSIHKKLHIEFIHNDIKRFDEHIEITIYRLFTELINNTLKHAKATQVKLKLTENENTIILKYQDNGIGFDPDSFKLAPKGMGLENFRSRVQSFNGLFLLKSKPGEGVYVSITLPKTI